MRLRNFTKQALLLAHLFRLDSPGDGSSTSLRKGLEKESRVENKMIELQFEQNHDVTRRQA